MEFLIIGEARLLTRENIVDSGIADSRVGDLLRAARKIHSAVCALDHNGKACLAVRFPEVLTVARMCGQADEFLDGLEDVIVEEIEDES